MTDNHISSHHILLLVASIVPLIVGPFIVKALRHNPLAVKILDFIVVAAIGGLVILHILPDAIMHAGLIAIFAAVVGLTIPFINRLPISSTKDRTNFGKTFTTILGMLALTIHAVVDGIALTGHNHVLSLAVVLHRLPVGIAIWWLILDRHSSRIALISVIVIIVASIFGFFGATKPFMAMSGDSWAVFQALVAGILLHVVIGHRFRRDEPLHTH